MSDKNKANPPTLQTSNPLFCYNSSMLNKWKDNLAAQERDLGSEQQSGFSVFDVE